MYNHFWHSKFGGMWIDRSDFAEQLQERIREGKIPECLENDIRQFEKDGVIVLEGAASEAELVQFENAISTAFRDGHEHLISQEPGSGKPKRVTPGSNRKGIRIVDSFAVIPAALDLLSSERLTEFLRIIFDDRPQLFQSLSFDTGSEQGLHQDTAYVVVDRPMELLACWIALEDVQPGSGELQYMVGSHRLPDFEFGAGRKHWDTAADGIDPHTEWFKWILSEGDQRGYPIKKFAAKRGDILIWHADLAHGGSAILNPDITRKSLVGHYCPDSAVPYFVKLSPDRTTKLTHRNICYRSWHYDLAALNSPEQKDSFLEGLFTAEG